MPHISLVFREMWDTTNLNFKIPNVKKTPKEVGRVPQVRPSVPGPKKTGDLDFLPRAPPTSACAAFIKESRMGFINAIKINRKSRGSPSNALRPLIHNHPGNPGANSAQHLPRYALGKICQIPSVDGVLALTGVLP